jgi:hypothetical protein
VAAVQCEIDSGDAFVVVFPITMIAPLDLFRTEKDGSALWLGSFADLEAAKERIKELAASNPAEYFIFSQTTGHKLFVRPDGT